VAACPYCTQELPPGAQRCPLCEHALPSAEDNKSEEVGVDGVYDLSNAVTKIPSDWQSAAVYTLEHPARCPNCREPIRSVRVLRMTRTHAAFTSPLPRGGRAMVCPECERIISIELSAFS
jgi:hypothetical protein